MRATRHRFEGPPALHETPGKPATWGIWPVACTVLLLLSRLALMWFGPLADTTEARYGELARQTAVNGYWLMPHMDPATPFFAKPPLSTWASAAAMRLLGVSEFAARLPALLAAGTTLWIVYRFARELGVRTPALVVPVLMTCPLFFVAAGAVMTDALQMMIVAAAQYCAWRVLATGDLRGRRWCLGFWLMIGIGALIKGLATWALIALPIMVYGVVQRDVRRAFMRLWHPPGFLAALALFLPWYVAAEIAYPGFLRYFIVGEHFARFLVPGWAGDRYGFAHRQPIGAIWMFWMVAIVPWLPAFVMPLYRALHRRRWSATPDQRYLWCATLAPLVFFTFSRNIIWTYALTALPPFALLAAQRLERLPASRRQMLGIALTGYAALAFAATPIILQRQEAYSDRALVQAWQRLPESAAPLAFTSTPSFSSAFYTAGKVTGHANSGGLMVIPNVDLNRRSNNTTRILFRGPRHSLVRLP